MPVSLSQANVQQRLNGVEQYGFGWVHWVYGLVYLFIGFG
jgi:hypothetical protein